MLDLAKWSSFYVIAGSAAGALIGLQFVVMTLIAGGPALRAAEAGAAFATPTIIHFGVVLLLSAAASVPFVVAAATLLLLFVGIHNAWDAVTYHVFTRTAEQPEDEQRR
jgi:hypothetical protein